MTTTEPRLRMLEAQQLQLLQSVASLQEQVRNMSSSHESRPAKRARHNDNHDTLRSLLSRLGDEEDEPAHEEVARTVPSASTVTSMDRVALRNLWQQIGSLGPLRKNASEKTMRRAIKAHIRTASH